MKTLLMIVMVLVVCSAVCAETATVEITSNVPLTTNVAPGQTDVTKTTPAPVPEVSKGDINALRDEIAAMAAERDRWYYNAAEALRRGNKPVQSYCARKYYSSSRSLNILRQKYDKLVARMDTFEAANNSSHTFMKGQIITETNDRIQADKRLGGRIDSGNDDMFVYITALAGLLLIGLVAVANRR